MTSLTKLRIGEEDIQLVSTLSIFMALIQVTLAPCYVGVENNNLGTTSFSSRALAWTWLVTEGKMESLGRGYGQLPFSLNSFHQVTCKYQTFNLLQFVPYSLGDSSRVSWVEKTLRLALTSSNLEAWTRDEWWTASTAWRSRVTMWCLETEMEVL